MPRMPLVSRDPRSGVFSVELVSGQFARTVQIDEDHLVDLDAGGRVLSIEVLDPANPKIEEIAARFGIEDQVPEILAAIDASLTPKAGTATSGSSFQQVQGVVRIVDDAGGELVLGKSAGTVQPREITLTP